MKINFECTLKYETKKVKLFLVENEYKLISKRIKGYKSIVVDTITKEYSFESCFYFQSTSVFWLFKYLVKEFEEKLTKKF